MTDIPDVPDVETTTALAAELLPLAPCEFVFQASSLLMLVGIVQLACRHPAFDGQTREFADRFVAKAREYFAACPTALAVITKGDDPRHDRPLTDRWLADDPRLYDVAKRVSHEFGYEWTDPRTGVIYPPPRRD